MDAALVEHMNVEYLGGRQAREVAQPFETAPSLFSEKVSRWAHPTIPVAHGSVRGKLRTQTERPLGAFLWHLRSMVRVGRQSRGAKRDVVDAPHYQDGPRWCSTLPTCECGTRCCSDAHIRRPWSFDWPTLLQEWKRTTLNLTLQELVPYQLSTVALRWSLEDVANGPGSETTRRLEAGPLHDEVRKSAQLAQTCGTDPPALQTYFAEAELQVVERCVISHRSLRVCDVLVFQCHFNCTPSTTRCQAEASQNGIRLGCVCTVMVALSSLEWCDCCNQHFVCVW